MRLKSSSVLSSNAATKVKAKVKAVASAEAAVRGAAIVATATNSIEPVLLESWLEPGMFITFVKELEFEDAVYERCDLLTANRRGPIWARYVVGGSQTIVEQGREIWYRWTQEQWKSVQLIGRIMAGREQVRTDLYDRLSPAYRILYDLACKQGLGVEAPVEFFHQDKKYIP